MKGWQASGKAGQQYKGEWLRIDVHNIHGLEPNEWFVTCHDLRIDCVKLDALDIEAAREEARLICFKMTQRYQRDLLAALRAPAAKTETLTKRPADHG